MMTCKKPGLKGIPRREGNLVEGHEYYTVYTSKPFKISCLEIGPYAAVKLVLEVENERVEVFTLLLWVRMSGI